MQEYDQVAAKLVRRLRERALVDLLAASDLEKKADFEDKKALERLLKAIEKAKLKIEAKIAYDEEHSLTNCCSPAARRPGAHQLGAGFDAGLQAPARAGRAIARIGQAAVHGDAQRRQGRPRRTPREVLAYVLEDAKKDFTITRFKGLGEMNPEQLWETTMNAETRTLLQVKLEDVVAAEKIFTTLMGENVESAANSSRKMRSTW